MEILLENVYYELHTGEIVVVQYDSISPWTFRDRSLTGSDLFAVIW